MVKPRFLKKLRIPTFEAPQQNSPLGEDTDKVKHNLGHFQ